VKLVFFDARVWRYLVSAISKVIDEGVFIVSPEEGLRFRAMDPSHVILLEMKFPPDSFEQFEVGEERSIGVNFEDLAKILRRARKEDRLELEADETTFTVTLSGRGIRRFSLPILDITAEDIPEPQLEFKAHVKVMSDVYRDTVKDVELVGDVIKFYASSDEFRVVSSSEFGEAEIIYTRESGSLLELEVEDVQQASYTLEYFSDLSGASRVADTITIKFSSEMPVQVDHELPQGAYFGFLVAPRVE
jgi:proliferating cell nuclear antigen